MSEDLITWLRAQLDEDERIARAHAGYEEAWRADHGPDSHLTRFGPTRILAEVEAKRQILDEHETLEDTPGVRYCRCCEGDRGYPASGPPPCRTVRLLALPYAARPGYRPEWAPLG